MPIYHFAVTIETRQVLDNSEVVAMLFEALAGRVDRIEVEETAADDDV